MPHSMFLRACFILLFALLPLSAMAQTEPLAPPALEGGNPLMVEEGYFHLRWNDPLPEAKNFFDLEEARSEEFQESHPVYSGAETSLFVSGLRDGDYFYRVRSRFQDQSSPWSQVQHIKVRHHSLTRAWWLFAAGAFAFGLILAVIFWGSRDRKGEGS